MNSVIYFAVNKEMWENNCGHNESGQLFYLLNSMTYCNYIVQDTAGKVLDCVRKYNKEKIGICKAIVSPDDIAAAFACTLSGDSNKFKLNIEEITWID